MLWRPGAGRQAACRAVSPRRLPRRLGPCQDLRSKAWSRSLRSWSRVGSLRPAAAFFKVALPPESIPPAAKKGLDRIVRAYYFWHMRKGEVTRQAILEQAAMLASQVGLE